MFVHIYVHGNFIIIFGGKKLNLKNELKIYKQIFFRYNSNKQFKI